MSAYADTGALVSLYVEDIFSSSATRWLGGRGDLALTPLHRAEFANALALGVFRRVWTPAASRAVQSRFHEDQGTGRFELQPWPDDAWLAAAELSHRYSVHLGVRTLDALHVAAALALDCEIFVSFDLRQRRLALAAGLELCPVRQP